MIGRRALLAGGVVAAGVAGLPPLVRWLRAPDLSYKALPGLPGFRKLSGGEVSGGNPMLIGVEDGAEVATRPEICAHLYETPDPAARVPVAYFSDARCVYCRVLTPRLHDLAETAPVRITWHEWPLLGRTSQRAAQASLAARRQGAYQVFHDRLMGTPILPNDAYLRRIAEDAGIDADRLLRDMQSDAVMHQLARTARIARAFGFIGTPALVVGRTAIIGAVETWQLRHQIEAEQASSSPWPCA